MFLELSRATKVELGGFFGQKSAFNFHFCFEVILELQKNFYLLRQLFLKENYFKLY
jgi:hypothetical protein